MKNFLSFLLLTLIVCTLIGCSPQVRLGETSETVWKPRGPLFFVAPEGTYKGAIPCSNCPGIEVTLDFNADNSVVKSMRYIQSKNINTKENGAWVVTPGNIVQVTYPNKASREYYKAQNSGHLVMLNEKKELNINPSQAQFFIFNKN